MAEIYTLVGKVHFLYEKQNEPYRRYGEMSIAAEKCALHQEYPKKNGLVLFLEGCVA